MYVRPHRDTGRVWVVCMHDVICRSQMGERSRSCIPALSRYLACMHVCVALRRVCASWCGSNKMWPAALNCDGSTFQAAECVTDASPDVRGISSSRLLPWHLPQSGIGLCMVCDCVCLFVFSTWGYGKMGRRSCDSRGPLEDGTNGDGRWINSQRLDLCTYNVSRFVESVPSTLRPDVALPLRTKSALLMPSLIFSSSRRPALAMKALCRRGRKNW